MAGWFEEDVAAIESLEAVSPLAQHLWAKALRWSDQQLTEGFIPRRVALALFSAHEYLDAATKEPVRLEQLIAELTTLQPGQKEPLWRSRPDGSGYDIQGYCERRPSRAEVLTSRHRRSDRQSVAGRSRAARAARDGGGRFQTPEIFTPQEPLPFVPARAPASDQPAAGALAGHRLDQPHQPASSPVKALTVNGINIPTVKKSDSEDGFRRDPRYLAMSWPEKRAKVELAVQIGEELDRLSGRRGAPSDRNAGFQRLVAFFLPEHLVREALRATRDAVEDDRSGIRPLRQNPEAYFGGIVRRLCHEHRIHLGIRWGSHKRAARPRARAPTPEGLRAFVH